MNYKKYLTWLFLFLFFGFSFAENVNKSVSQNVNTNVSQNVTLTVFFQAMDGQSWQLFFIADAIKRRLPDIKLDIYPLVSKKDGKWYSERGDAEIKESARLMGIKNKYPKKVLLYLSARSLNPYPDGWRDALIFSDINPVEFSKYVEENKEKLLSQAFEKAKNSGIENSAFLINGKLYDGEYTILKVLEAINEKLPPSARANLYKEQLAMIKPPAFKIVVSEKTKDWNDERIENVFKRYFPNLKPEKVFYEDPKTKEIFGELKFLPAYAIEDTESVRENLSQPINSGVFERVGNYYVFYNKNSKGILPGFKEEPKKLEMFVMSQCPYGVMAENSIIESLNNGKIDKNIKIEIHYIADAIKNEKGELQGFRSLHGDEEWKEDVRQLLIKKNYPDKFYSYLLERNKNYSSSQWQDAAKKVGIDVQKIEQEMENGKKLLEEDIKKANSLDINTSPTFLVNGNILVVGIKELSELEDYKSIELKTQSAGGAGCSQ